MLASQATAVLALKRDPCAPKTARDWVSRQFGAGLGNTKLDTAKLLVSELVTNALLHGHGAIAVRARLRQGRLFVEIADEGSGFSWTAPEQDRDHHNGWGLLLVDSESDRWGMHEDRTRVWFELAV